ncbi:hypothetical protein Tsubulata_004548 [Turnera subulata]|uniref:Uncharacterized protein n=1 Tax=Turnera subulata TaxID=218843 RepID=A0A9Q0FR92_9ROSI|nr:hypothetical protein Tsubulata_004548 [Turnera subulata]
MPTAAEGEGSLGSWDLGKRCWGFHGWSLSGWRPFEMRLLGRRPSFINGAPSWHKEAHVCLPPIKFVDIEGGNCGSSDEDRDVGEEEEEEVVTVRLDSRMRAHLELCYGRNAVSGILEYFDDTSGRLHRGALKIMRPVPNVLREQFDRVFGYPLRFGRSHPLYANITINCVRSVQEMELKRGIRAYADTVRPEFFIIFYALDARTHEKHYCQTQVIHDEPYYIDPDIVREEYDVPSFSRLPPVDCEGSKSVDPELIQREMTRTVRTWNPLVWSPPLGACAPLVGSPPCLCDAVQPAAHSILAADSDLRTKQTGMLSAKKRRISLEALKPAAMDVGDESSQPKVIP